MMGQKFRYSRTGVLVLIWFVGIISFYFISHKPISNEFALNVLRYLGQLASAFVLISVAGGIGAYLLSGLGLHSLAQLSLQAAFGLGLLGLCVLVIGSTIGFNSIMSWGLLIFTGFVLRKNVYRWWGEWKVLKTYYYIWSKFSRLIALIVSLILIITLVVSLAPPVKYDSLVYHLTLPREYISVGKLTYLYWNVYWGMPQITEMLYSWGMAMAGDETAVVISWGSGVLAIVGLLGYGIQRLGTRAAWVSVAALLSGFTLASSLSWGYVGWFTILFGFCVLSTLDLWVLVGDRRLLLISGAFAGLALGVKYSAGVIVLAGLGVILYHRLKRGVLKDLFLFGGMTTLFSIPWGIKNFLATGNPFFPFIISGGAMDQLRLSHYQNLPPWGNWKDIVFLPVRATYYGVEGAPGYSASVGPLLLGLGALFWVGWKDRTQKERLSIKNAAIIAFIGIFVWGILGRLSGLLIQSRLYLVVFPAFAFLAGVGFLGIERIRWPGVRLGRVTGVLILFVLLLNLIQVGITAIKQETLQVLLSLKSPTSFLEENLGMHALVMEAIEELPPESQVLMLWEPRSYYCRPTCFPDDLLDKWLSARYHYGTESEILDAWRQSGMTHLLFYRIGADFIQREDTRYHDSDWQSLEALLSGLSIYQDFDQVYTLYSLSP